MISKPITAFLTGHVAAAPRHAQRPGWTGMQSRGRRPLLAVQQQNPQFGAAYFLIAIRRVPTHIGGYARGWGDTSHLGTCAAMGGSGCMDMHELSGARHPLLPPSGGRRHFQPGVRPACSIQSCSSGRCPSSGVVTLT
jgi:hypothetical protein